jgi:hypothetical protein
MSIGMMRATFLAASLVLAASCGGGGGGSSGGGGGGIGVSPPPPPPVVRLSPAETGRFLTQATFGPTATEIETLRDQSFASWIAGQQSAPQGASALTYMDDRLVVLKAANANAQLNATHFYEYFWRFLWCRLLIPLSIRVAWHPIMTCWARMHLVIIEPFWKTFRFIQ